MTGTAVQALERQSERGWMFPYLLAWDIADVNIANLSRAERKQANIQETAPSVFKGWGRWGYWLWIVKHNRLPGAPIPQIPFDSAPRPNDAKAMQNWLKPHLRFSRWYDEAFMKLVKWLLHGFGRPGLEKEIAEIDDEIKIHWYRNVNLVNLLHSPCDWPAFVLQGGLSDDKANQSPWARSTGFYSTPLDVCRMMQYLIMETEDPLVDTRVLTVQDPCCGTSSQLLLASNNSLRLSGQDVVRDLVLCSELNGWLWMPWLVHMPGKTQEMLERRAGELAQFRRMRALLTGAPYRLEREPEEERAAIGIELSNNQNTHTLAEQRAGLRRAIIAGKLEQGTLWQQPQEITLGEF